MSVIFKSLEKLKRQSSDDRLRDRQLQRKKDRHPLRKTIFSPVTIFFFLLVLIPVIYGVQYGIFSLKNHYKIKKKQTYLSLQDKKPRPAHAQNRSTKPPEKGLPQDKDNSLTKESTDHIQATEIPPSPAMPSHEKIDINRSDIQHQRLTQFAYENPSAPVTAGNAQARYLPQTHDVKRFEDTGKVDKEAASHSTDLNTASPLQPKTEYHLRSPPASNQVRNGANDRAFLYQSPENDNTPSLFAFMPKEGSKMNINDDKGADRKSVSQVPGPFYMDGPPVTREKTYIPTPREALSEFPANSAFSKNPLSESSGELSREATELFFIEPESQSAKRYKIHIANIEKSQKTTRLVSKIHKAMSHDDNDRVEDLLDQLKVLKGDENSYVMKLKAFWLLKQGDYDSAALILEKVLEKNENDMEAGINMAVVELNTDQQPDAWNRLSKLKEIYPDNTLIPELMRKLKK